MSIFMEIQASYKKYIDNNNKIDYDDILEKCKNLKHADFKQQVLFFQKSISILGNNFDILIDNLYILIKEMIEKFDEDFIERETDENKKNNLKIFRVNLIKSLDSCVHQKESMEELRVYVDNTLRFETDNLSKKEKLDRFNVQVEWIQSHIVYLKERDREYNELFWIYRINLPQFVCL